MSASAILLKWLSHCPVVSCGRFFILLRLIRLSLSTSSGRCPHHWPSTKCCHSLVFSLLIDASHKLSHLYFLATLFLIASFLTHLPHTPLYFNYAHLFEIPQISFACSYLSLDIMFPLPDNFLVIFIIANRYHSRLSIYQFLWTAFPALSLRGRVPQQPVIVPSWRWTPQMLCLHFSPL